LNLPEDKEEDMAEVHPPSRSRGKHSESTDNCAILRGIR